jgi:hypothetical protein
VTLLVVIGVAAVFGVGVAALTGGVRGGPPLGARGALVELAGRRLYLRTLQGGEEGVVSGDVRGARLRAPLSGRRCACWELLVRVEHERDFQFEEIGDAYVVRRGASFELVEVGAIARVDPDGAELVLVHDRSIDRKGVWQLSPSLRRALEAAVPAERMADPKTVISVREAIVGDGARVVVRALADREPAPAGTPASYRDAAPHRIVLRAPMTIAAAERVR